MKKTTKFGVSLESELLNAFDQFIKNKGVVSRSQEIGILIRESLVKKEWYANKKTAGVIILVYDHHKPALVNKLASVQHDFHHLIISTQHIHLDHHNCFEIIVIKTKPCQAHKLLQALKSVKGIKHAALNLATTGNRIP